MKKTVFSLLGVLMLVFSGCMDKGGNSQYVERIVGIAGYSDLFQPAIITASETFLAPELQKPLLDGDLYEGDALIASFNLDLDNQPSTEYYTASQLEYMKITTGSSIYPTPEGESMTDDFSAPIEALSGFAFVGNVMFFGFVHYSVPQDQAFDYELTFPSDPVEDADYPTIYLRAKESGTGTQSKTNIEFLYAFNMSSFFYTLQKDADNNVKFYIKYKGVDGEGNDVYKDWADANGNKLLTVTLE
jgi:hypothetical protein